MFIQTERLVLRNILETDKNDYYDIFKDEETCQYVPSDPWTKETLDEQFHQKISHQSLKENRHVDLACVFNGKVIGDIGFWYVEMKETLEIGYTFHKNYSGKGYATEALKAIIEYVFKELNIHRIYANIDARNIPSARLCERVGMRKEAHFIQDYWMKGEWTDSFIYSMLKDDMSVK